MKLSKDQPIQIQSDQLEIKDEEKKAYFTGNVEVVQGTTTMKSAKMTVLYKDKDKGGRRRRQEYRRQPDLLRSGGYRQDICRWQGSAQFRHPAGNR